MGEDMTPRVLKSRFGYFRGQSRSKASPICWIKKPKMARKFISRQEESDILECLVRIYGYDPKEDKFVFEPYIHWAYSEQEILELFNVPTEGMCYEKERAIMNYVYRDEEEGQP